MRHINILMIFLVLLLYVVPVVYITAVPDKAEADCDNFDLLSEEVAEASSFNPGAGQKLYRMPTGIGNGPNGGDIYLWYGDGYAYSYEVEDDGEMELVEKTALSEYGGGTASTSWKGQWAYSGYTDIYVLLAAGSDLNYAPTLGTYHVSSTGSINSTIIDSEANTGDMPYWKSTHHDWSLYQIEGSHDLTGAFSGYTWNPGSYNTGIIMTWNISSLGQITVLDRSNMGSGVYPFDFEYLWTTGGDNDLMYGLSTDRSAGSDVLMFVKVDHSASRDITKMPSYTLGTDVLPSFARMENSFNLILSTYGDESSLGIMECTQDGTIIGFAGGTVSYSEITVGKTDIRFYGEDTYGLVYYGDNVISDTYVRLVDIPLGTTDLDSDDLTCAEPLGVGTNWYCPSPATTQLNDLDDNYAIVSSGTWNGSTSSVTFVTIQVNLPTAIPVLTTQDATNITSTTCTGNGTITDIGGVVPTFRGFCWNLTGTPTTSDYGWYEEGTFSVGAYSGPVTGLPLTTIYMRSFATNSEGTGYGNEIEISLGEPIVYTLGVVNAGTNTTSMIGWISSVGGSSLTERGFYYNTTGSPTSSDNTVGTVFALSTGEYYENATGLTPNTLYYFRAFATNSYGTDTGDVLTFNTVPSYSDNTMCLDFQPTSIIPPSSPGTITDVSSYGNNASYILADMIDGVTVYVSNETSDGGGFYPSPSSDFGEILIVPPQSGMEQQGDASLLPLYEVFEEAGDSIGMEPALLYIMMVFGVSMGIGFLIYLLSGSLLVSLIIMTVMLAGFMSTGVMPLWVLIFFVAFSIGLMYIMRQS